MEMNYLNTNFSNICRTCLTENSSMKSLFSCEEIMEQKILLCDMLMSCASVLVLHGDGLPENICLTCSQQVNTAYLFRKLSERSDTTLRGCSVLNNDHNNIFTIQMENSKFDINLEDQSLSQHEQNAPSSENENCKTVDFEDESMDTEQNNSDESDVDETVLKSNKDNFSLDSFDADITGHISKINFKCQHCGKEFNRQSFLARHMLVHENNLSKTDKRRNKTGVTRKRNQPRTCEICNKTFRFHSNLERHKLTHTGEKPFLCNVCGKGFAQMAYLKIHSFIHTGEKPYKCQMCDRSFAAPGTLMTHVRTHTGERPHICKICGKDFPQSGYLSAHIRTHTGEKPIECKVCNRRFNQSGRLIIHMRSHSGEKPYQCTMCGRSFAVKGTLKKHIRTHTGEKPYKCKVCSQAFAQSGTLATHMKIHKPKADNAKLIPWTN